MENFNSDTIEAIGNHQLRSCGTMVVHRNLLNSSDEYARARSIIENIAQAKFADDGAIIRIPVVVHVVWQDEAQNISDEQINSQICVLNDDFRAKNDDIQKIPQPFLDLCEDARIEFYIPQIPADSGNKSAIIRRETTVDGFSTNDAVKKTSRGGSDSWPSDKYLNIWVCKLEGGLLGYAQFPGGPPETDGIVVSYRAFGTNGTASPPFNLGRTATHEIGHWLNLFHIWGDDGTACNQGDNVDDTPNQGGANTGKPQFPRISCSNAPYGDMFMNYMDYVDDDAMFMFTKQQVIRMRTCLMINRAGVR